MLEEKIKELAELRQAFIGISFTYLECKKAFEEGLVYKTYKLTQDKLEQLESEIRTEAVKIFELCQNKNPHPAVEIKENPILTYETEKALIYAKTNYPDTVIPQSLDRKVFDAMIKTLQKKSPEKVPNFITISKVPKVNIDKDLSGYLKEE